MSAPRRVAIVPVRVGSTRLPGKALLDETGKPLFLHTWERAERAETIDLAVVATDDDRVESVASEHGVPIVRTSPECRTGSERCAEAARQIGAQLVVNVQGDWPEVEPKDLDALIGALEAGADTATLAAPLDGPRSLEPNVVKVVRARDGRALYFSRAAIPCSKDATDDAQQSAVPRLRHIGVYAFRREILEALPELPSSGLDETEGLEQLKLLENGIAMQVLDATGAPWGIEAREDYDLFVKRERETREAGR